VTTAYRNVSQNSGKTGERTYQPEEDYPRRKHESREQSRDEGRWRLLLRAESVFDPGLWLVVDFLWVWDDGLRGRDNEIKEVNREGLVHE